MDVHFSNSSFFFFFQFPVCTQLLVSRPDEENISSYLQLIDKCLIHEVSRDRFPETAFSHSFEVVLRDSVR